MDAWERFLKSLESDGGKVLVLLSMIMFLFLAALLVVLTGHPLHETAKTLLATGTGSLLGILYGYLGKKSA